MTSQDNGCCFGGIRKHRRLVELLKVRGSVIEPHSSKPLTL